MKFTIDNVFDEDTTPVVKTETNVIVKPYISDSVKVGRYFYDFESDEKKQENSLREYCAKQGIIPDEIITAISLPSDYKKSKLIDLYKMIINYDIDTIYISAIDRIGIVEYPQFELLCSLFDTKIVNIGLTTKKYYKNENSENIFNLLKIIEKYRDN